MRRAAPLVLLAWLAPGLACEREDWDEIDQHAGLLGLSQRAVALAHLEALAWAENLGL